MGDKESFKLYLMVLLIGIFAGVMYVLRSITEQKIDTKTKAVVFVIQGIGSSMLLCFLAFEGAHYFGLPNSLCIAIGGGIGWLGGEVISRLFLRLFEKKILKE
ncbi:phage holin family protein [uncultured Helicobacter sp.]|uniref:phage holin family protein n=1 Tax=uncultured Helicobacter sp. TaxID=175537 RepID=UPI001FA3A9C0|nr:phage holin family protein [uncultured Helicobacter sp.]HIY43577.1 phage holin family protein [Candidatus Helicobacter avistercoris]